MNDTLKRIYGLKVDSDAYKLACEIADICIKKNITVAQDIFNERAKKLKLKYWETLAISACVVGLINN